MFRFLLVVFNKSVQLHSESVFPSNVTVKTANALSYRYIMATESSNRFVAWGLKYTDLLEHSLIPHHNMGKGTVWEGFNIYQRAAMITETLSGFYMSVDKNVQLAHAPKEWQVGKKTRETREIPEGAREQLVEDAVEVWKKIVGGRKVAAKFSFSFHFPCVYFSQDAAKFSSFSPEIFPLAFFKFFLNFSQVAAKFDHNSSMKKFQLAKPDIAQFVKMDKLSYQYDVLLLDEAQDMNPAMLDICLNQVFLRIFEF